MTNNYKYVKDEQGLRESIERWKGKEAIGVDTETTGLDFFNDRVRLLQLAVQSEPTLVIDCFTLTQNSKKILCGYLLKPITKIFHHAKFDLHFFGERRHKDRTSLF